MSKSVKQTVATTSAKSKRKAPAAVETRSSIEEQTKAFLKGGGKIESIPRGVSGQNGLKSSRHITISSKPAQNS
jgi:hypothetical protein